MPFKMACHVQRLDGGVWWYMVLYGGVWWCMVVYGGICPMCLTERSLEITTQNITGIYKLMDIILVGG